MLLDMAEGRSDLRPTADRPKIPSPPRKTGTRLIVSCRFHRVELEARPSSGTIRSTSLDVDTVYGRLVGWRVPTAIAYAAVS